MANRNLDFDPTVTQAEPTQDQALTLADTGAQIADKAAEMSASGKALLATADTQTQFRNLNADFKLKNASDPTNPEALQKLQNARQAVIDQNMNNVPGIAVRAYQNKAIEIGTQNDALLDTWKTQQQFANAKKDLITSQHGYYMAANQAGQIFGMDPNADISSALQYKQALSSIHQFSDPIVGSDKVAAATAEFSTNYVKSFIAGVAENHPERAAQLLTDPAITQHFTTQDIGDMADLIQRTSRQQDLIKTEQIGKKTGDVTNLVNDEGQTYFEKRAQIDQMELDGSISAKTAANARRVIKSAQDLETQTDAPVMAELIKRTYDINENTSLDKGAYLNAVKGLQEDVLQRQTSGELSGHDAQRLTNQINTLTNKRVADATKAVGVGFTGANDLFTQLPPEYRGEATRQLFYETSDKDYPPLTMAGKALNIINGINATRRQSALRYVATTSSDDVLLQSLGYTRDQVAETAKNRGISPDQVVKQLRAKYSKKQKSKIKNIAPEDVLQPNSTPDGGMQINAPAPDETTTDGEE